MPTTLRDIARLAGVDVGTVSRALSDSPRVAAATKAKVAELAHELCYTPNYSARSLRNRSTKAISVVRFTVGMIELHSEWLACLAQEARRLGYRVRLDMVDDFDAVVNEQSVDGFVLPFSPRYLPGSIAKREAADAPPMIFTDCEPVATNAVWMGNRQGATDAVAHLRELGHERLAFFGDIAHAPVCVERVMGFREACGVGPTSAEVAHATCVALPHWPMEVNDALVARGQLADLLRNGVTGVVAASDVAALAVLRVAAEMGLSVPGDVSVVGFDDTRLARSCVPAVTSVRQNVAAASVAAMDLLAGVLAAGQALPSICIPMTLAVRGSAGPCHR